MAQMHEVRNGMQVLGSDGGMIGTVTGTEGDQIAVAAAGDGGGTDHHHVPREWVERVDDHVHLNRTAALARDTWLRHGEKPRTAGATASGGGTAGRGEAATDRPARGSKWIWIVGAIMLLIVLFLLARGLGYAGSDPIYEQQATGTISEADRQASGAAAADPAQNRTD